MCVSVSSLVEHSASDHSQVLKHTQVAPFLWPGLYVQIPCTEKSDACDDEDEEDMKKPTCICAALHPMKPFVL